MMQKTREGGLICSTNLIPLNNLDVLNHIMLVLLNRYAALIKRSD